MTVNEEIGRTIWVCSREMRVGVKTSESENAMCHADYHDNHPPSNINPTWQINSHSQHPVDKHECHLATQN
jgi:hypothetical protein